MKKPPPDGPVESGPWPDTLAARAVSPGPSPRLWGYDVHGDLVKNYGLAEMAWLAGRGELAPGEMQIKVFEVVLGYLGPVNMAQAPSHAAGLSRICGSKPSAVVSVGALTLAEQARVAVQDHASMWRWLKGQGLWPPGLQAGAAEVPVVAGLAQHLDSLGYTHVLFAKNPGVVSACLGVLFDLGFEEPEQLITLWVWCRLPYVSAEAFAAKPGALGDYPMNVPAYEYEGPDE